jgi:hypothetical protein
MKKHLLGLGLAGLLAVPAAADTMFLETFEGTLGAWQRGYHYLPASGTIVADPLQGDHALNFGHLNSGGDIFSVTAFDSPDNTYILTFDYLGMPVPGGNPSDRGGFLGYSYGLPGTHVWLAGTQNSYGTPINLIDDGAWHTYTYTFTAAGSIRLMLEDFVGSGGVPRDAFFDNIQLTDGNGPTPAAVPEPGTLALMGLGLAGLGFAARRKRA